MYIKSGVQEESEILKAITKLFITNKVELEIELPYSAYQYGKYSLKIISSMPSEDVFNYICFVLKLNPLISLPFNVLAGIDSNVILTYSRNNLNVYATKNFSKTLQVRRIERLLKEQFEVSQKHEYYHYQSIVHCGDVNKVLNCLEPLNGDVKDSSQNINSNTMFRIKNLNALIYSEDDKTYFKYFGV